VSALLLAACRVEQDASLPCLTDGCLPARLLFPSPPSLQLSFLLPPDHELGSGDTGVSIFNQMPGANLSEVFPLRSLRILPFTAPPPAWLAGLQRLLPHPIGAGSADSGTASSSQGGAELSSGLVLRRLAEHADRFELEFVVGDDLGGTVTSSGLQLGFPDAPAGGGSCRQLQLTLKEPAKLRATLSLPWPVDSLTAKVRVRRRYAATSTAVPPLTQPSPPKTPQSSACLSLLFAWCAAQHSHH
jgi:hypothetical protein